MRGAGFERIHEGSAAEEYLRGICANPDAKSGRGDQRGLYHALWYLQNEKAIPDRWTEGVRQGLVSVVDLAARSHEERLLDKALSKEYERYFTPTGRPAKNSPIHKVKEEFEKVESDYQSCCVDYKKLTEIRENLKILKERHSASLEKLNKIQQERLALEPALEQIPVWEEEMRRNDQEVEEKRIINEAISTDLTAYTNRLDNIRNEEEECCKQTRLIQDAEARCNSARTNAEVCRRDILDRIEPALDATHLRLRSIQKVQEYRRLQEERSGIETHLKKIEEAVTTLQTHRLERDALHVPDQDLLTQIRKDKLEIERLLARIDGGAIHIELNLESERQSFEITPEPFKTEDTILLTATTTITFPGVGSIRISGMPGSLQTERESINSLHQGIMEFLTSFAAASVEELGERSEAATRLDHQIENQMKLLSELVISRSVEEAHSRLEEVKIEIERLYTESAVAINVFGSMFSSALTNAATTCESQEREFLNEKQAQERGMEQFSKNADAVDQEREDAKIAYATAETRLKGARDQNIEILDRYGDFNRLQHRSTEEKQDLANLETTSALFTEDKKREIEHLHGEKHRLSDALTSCEQAERDCSDELIGAEKLYDTLSQRDLEGDMEELQQHVELACQRLTGVESQAMAISTLQHMVQALEAEQSAGIARPLQEQVRPWLPIVLGDKYSDLELGSESLHPDKIYSSHYNTMLPTADLSFGAYEQVVVLLRLALGVVLSSEERQLVVLDDRLVNADPLRVAQFCTILKKVARESCQIILATCDESPYASIGGKVIHVPNDGIISS